MARSGKVAAATVAAVVAMAATLFYPREGLRHMPYRDIVGVLTVCRGHTGPDIQNRYYSTAECNALADADLREAYTYVAKCIPPETPIEIQAALDDMTANLGPRAVCGSTIQRMARAHKWKSVCAGILAWINAGGVPNNSIADRRVAEREMCLRYDK